MLWGLALWLWRRPVATAPIQPLPWEPPYAVAVALKRQKEKKKKKKKKEGERSELSLTTLPKGPSLYSDQSEHRSHFVLPHPPLVSQCSTQVFDSVPLTLKMDPARWAGTLRAYLVPVSLMPMDKQESVEVWISLFI